MRTDIRCQRASGMCSESGTLHLHSPPPTYWYIHVGLLVIIPRPSSIGCLSHWNSPFGFRPAYNHLGFRRLNPGALWCHLTLIFSRIKAGVRPLILCDWIKMSENTQLTTERIDAANVVLVVNINHDSYGNFVSAWESSICVIPSIHECRNLWIATRPRY